MYDIVIVEDERPAVTRLAALLSELLPEHRILAVLDSVEESSEWFAQHPPPHLAFLDIHLADGYSFSIFERTRVDCPVIFTTAFDEHALQAFKVNSIDYLLKPIAPEELQRAWAKFERLHHHPTPDFSALLRQFEQQREKTNYRKRFLTKSGDQFVYLETADIATFYSEDGLTFALHQAGKRYLIDEPLDRLEPALDPHHFFRVNRKFIVRNSAIERIASYFNSRLLLYLRPQAPDQVIVARERVGSFKNWLNR